MIVALLHPQNVIKMPSPFAFGPNLLDPPVVESSAIARKLLALQYTPKGLHLERCWSALFVHESRLERYPALKDMTENSPRKHPRYASEGRVTVTVQRPEGKLSFWGIVANLSQNGLASTVVGNLTLGEIVTLRFSPLPGYPELQIRARVSHQKGYYCGFEFLWLNDIDRQSLEKACSELSRT